MFLHKHSLHEEKTIGRKETKFNSNSVPEFPNYPLLCIITSGKRNVTFIMKIWPTPPLYYTATYGSNSLCTDQSTDEKYKQCDYMSTDENETITGSELEILLKHRSVDIIIHIVHAGKVDAMAFNAGNLLIHTKDGATVTPLSLGNADMDNTRTWQAHLPSDNVIDPDGSALFSFFFDGKEYPAKYSLANAKDVIASGTRLIVTANFNFKLDAVAIEILSWTDEKQSPDGVSPDI